MTRNRFITWMVLGPLLNIAAFTQSNAGGQASGTNSECDAQVEAYLSQRDSCSDFYAQLNFLKLRIDDAREQQRKLWQQCQDARDRSACEKLAGLSAGRIAIMEQEYETMALRGCQTNAPTPAGIAKSCKAGTDVNAKKAAANQNSDTPASQKHDPGKTKDLAQSPSASHQQNAAQDRSASNVHTHPQPVSSFETTRASGGAGFSRQSDLSGVSRGAVSSPPAAPAASASSAGAGRVKD